MKKQKRDRIIAFMSYKHSMLTRVVTCLLIISFTLANVTYGHDRSNTLRMARENRTTKEALKAEFGQPGRELQVKTLTKGLAETHIDELVSVGEAAYLPTGEPLWGKSEFLADSIEGGKVVLHNKWRYSQIAFYRGKVVGYLIVYQRDDKVIVCRFAVLPELQRKGLGVAIELIRKAREAVLQDGVTHVETAVYCKNPIIGLYKKLGFKQIGSEERDGKKHYLMRLVVAELNIPPPVARKGRTSTSSSVTSSSPSSSIAEYFNSNTDLAADEILAVINRVVTTLANKQHHSRSEDFGSTARTQFFPTAQSLLANLPSHEGEFYQQTMSGLSFNIDDLSYPDMSFFFEDLLGREHIVINGRFYLNLPFCIRIIERDVDLLSYRFGAFHCSSEYPGSFGLSNIIRSPDGSIHIPPAQGGGTNRTEQASLETAIADVINSFFEEFVKCEILDVNGADVLDTFVFDGEILNRRSESQYVSAWMGIRETLSSNERLRQLLGSKLDRWIDCIFLLQKLKNFLNLERLLKEDKSGEMALVNYLVTTMRLNDFMEAEGLLSGVEDPGSSLSPGEDKEGVLRQWHRAWESVLERSRKHWKDGVHQAITMREDSPAMAYDPDSVPRRQLGPFLQLLFVSPPRGTRGAVSRRDLDEGRRKQTLLHKLISNILMIDPDDHSLAVVTNLWARVKYQSLLICREWRPQRLMPEDVATQVRWARRGTVVEFHRDRTFLDHIHMHLMPEESAPLFNFSREFTSDSNHAGLQTGRLDGYPVPHIALTSKDDSTLERAALKFSDMLDERETLFNQIVLRNPDTDQVYVLFFFSKDVNLPFEFNVIGIVRSIDENLALEDVFLGLKKRFLNERELTPIREGFLDEWQAGFPAQEITAARLTERRLCFGSKVWREHESVESGLFSDCPDVEHLIQWIRSNWDEIIMRGGFVFDVDQTLMYKNKSLSDPENRSLLECLANCLRHGIEIGVVSGGSIEEMTRRIVQPLKGALENNIAALQHLTLYTDSGSGKYTFDSAGREVLDRAYTNNNMISQKAILSPIHRMLKDEAKRKFRLGSEHMAAWVEWCERYYPGITFDSSWMKGNANWEPAVITPKELEKARRKGGLLTQPFIELRRINGTLVKMTIRPLVTAPFDMRGYLRSRAHGYIGPERTLSLSISSEGTSSIPIISANAGKEGAVTDFIASPKAKGKRLVAHCVFYFGDAMYYRISRDPVLQKLFVDMGNDESVARNTALIQDGLTVLGVNRAKPVGSSLSLWIGKGPKATSDLFRRILPDSLQNLPPLKPQDCMPKQSLSRAQDSAV